VGGGIGAFLILLVSFIFSKMIAKRSRKVNSAEDDEDEMEEDELAPHEDNADRDKADTPDRDEEVVDTEPAEVDREYAPELQRSDK
jgi:flagellar biosynthesis/type III secretory pathway M-ring protein FliF/YscJ